MVTYFYTYCYDYQWRITITLLAVVMYCKPAECSHTFCAATKFSAPLEHPSKFEYESDEYAKHYICLIKEYKINL